MRAELRIIVCGDARAIAGPRVAGVNQKTYDSYADAFAKGVWADVAAAELPTLRDSPDEEAHTVEIAPSPVRVRDPWLHIRKWRNEHPLGGAGMGPSWWDACRPSWWDRMLGLLHLPQKPLEGEYLVAWELEIIAEGEGDEGKVWLDSREMFNLTQALDRICAEAQYAGFQAADAAMKAARAE